MASAEYLNSLFRNCGCLFVRFADDLARYIRHFWPRRSVPTALDYKAIKDLSDRTIFQSFVGHTLHGLACNYFARHLSSLSPSHPHSSIPPSLSLAPLSLTLSSLPLTHSPSLTSSHKFYINARSLAYMNVTIYISDTEAIVHIFSWWYRSKIM